jgi:hypothetical protein
LFAPKFSTIQIIPLLQDLWPTRVNEKKMLIFCSDAAAYMLKAATALKVFYPSLIHFTCLAHGRQNVTKEVRAKFPQVNKLISMTKSVSERPTSRSYKQRLPKVALPPEPVPTNGEPG